MSVKVRFLGDEMCDSRHFHSWLIDLGDEYDTKIFTLNKSIPSSNFRPYNFPTCILWCLVRLFGTLGLDEESK